MDREYNTPYSPPSGEVYDDLGNQFYDNYPKIHQEEQAQKMAIRVARIYRKTPTVNVYEIDDNMALI